MQPLRVPGGPKRSANVYRLRAWMFDASFHPALGWALAAAMLGRFAALDRLGAPRAVRSLLRAHYVLLRTNRFDAATSRLYRRIERHVAETCRAGGPLHRMIVAEDARGVAAAGDLEIAGLVLKAPRRADEPEPEKGVLLLKNTERLRGVRRCLDLAALMRHYVLVLEPSWSGLANPEVLYFTNFPDHAVIVMTTGEQDLGFLRRLGRNLIPLALGASDWVNPSIFRPLAGVAKRYDVVMVARWTMMKRHHVLFRAICSDPSLRVALIASAWPTDTDRAAILALAESYGVSGQLAIFENLSPEEVNRILNQSKVNVLLSRQEGSNRALFEGFFAGVPGLALRTNVGVPRAHFAPQTGRLIAEAELPAALAHFREHWSEYAPRSWAERHIAPPVSTARLNAVLQRLARERGESWTRDIVVKCNSPRLRYYPDADAGRDLPTMADLLRDYPAARPSGARPARDAA